MTDHAYNRRSIPNLPSRRTRPNRFLMLTPAFVQRRIAHRPNLAKVLDNIGWLFFDRVLRVGVGLLVGVWVARYLGPEQFGLLNYATAFVALFGAIASLGLQGIVVRDLVKDPDEANITLGTAFVLQLVGGSTAVLAILTIINWLRPEDPQTRIIVAIVAFTLIFKSSEVIKYWFESQVASRNTVIVENSIFLAMAIVKVAMILKQAPLIAFVGILLAEATLVCVGLFAVYAKREGTPRGWSVRGGRAKRLLNDSWPLILSGLAIMVYMKTDQLMLKEMAGAEAVGLYSAALRISEAWYTIPMIVVASLFPTIIDSKQKSEELYHQRMQKLLNLLVAIALLVAVAVTLSATQIITLLYGSSYLASAPVLMIHVWAGVFTFIGVASSNWYLLEDMSRSLFYRTLAGALVNIPLNLALIPWGGAKGAAIATVISFSVAALFYDLATPRTRSLFRMKMHALSFRWIYANRK